MESGSSSGTRYEHKQTTKGQILARSIDDSEAECDFYHLENCLPLLSIGQLIQLIELKIIAMEACFGQTRRWYVKMINGESFEDKELIDCLWQAVKEIL